MACAHRIPTRDETRRNNATGGEVTRRPSAMTSADATSTIESAASITRRRAAPVRDSEANAGRHRYRVQPRERVDLRDVSTAFNRAIASGERPSRERSELHGCGAVERSFLRRSGTVQFEGQTPAFREGCFSTDVTERHEADVGVLCRPSSLRECDARASRTKPVKPTRHVQVSP